MTQDGSVSPFKFIRIPAVQNLNLAVPAPLLLGRSSPRIPRPPHQRDWVRVPNGTLHPHPNDLAVQSVKIPNGKPSYRPGRRNSPVIENPLVETPDSTSKTWRKFILSRETSHDSTTHFLIGTYSNGVVSDTVRVPLSSILDHVTPAALEEFENRDYEEEDRIEASRPPPKPRGRPRKGFHPALLGARDDTCREPSTTPDILALAEKRRGRPKRFAVAVHVPSSPDSPATHSPGHSQPSSARKPLVKVQIPSPLRPREISVTVPSFNGPAPISANQAQSNDDFSESSEDQLSSHPPSGRPQYSMVKASGLVPSETSADEETSREVSMSRAPSFQALNDDEPAPKRRKIELDEGLPHPPITSQTTSTSHEDNIKVTPAADFWRGSSNIVDLTDDESVYDEQESKGNEIDQINTDEIRDEELERQLLLQQFQVTSPKQSSSIDNSPTASKTQSSTLDQDLLYPAERLPITPRTQHRASIFAKTVLDEVNAQLQQQQAMLEQTSDTTTPKKPSYKRSSLTPVFPSSAIFGTLDGAQERKSHARQPSNTSPLQQRTVGSSIPNKTASIQQPNSVHAKPTPNTVPSSSSKSTAKTLSSNKSYASSNILRYTPHKTPPSDSKRDITKYFRPRTTPKKPPPPPPPPPPSLPPSAVPRNNDDSDSEDPLTQDTSKKTLRPRVPREHQPLQLSDPIIDPDQDDSGSYDPKRKNSGFYKPQKRSSTANRSGSHGLNARPNVQVQIQRGSSTNKTPEQTSSSSKTKAMTFSHPISTSTSIPDPHVSTHSTIQPRQQTSYNQFSHLFSAPQPPLPPHSHPHPQTTQPTSATIPASEYLHPSHRQNNPFRDIFSNTNLRGGGAGSDDDAARLNGNGDDEEGMGDGQEVQDSAGIEGSQGSDDSLGDDILIVRSRTG